MGLQIVTKHDFLDWIKNPSLLNDQTLPKIWSYYEKYPASPFLGFLLLKNLQKTDHPELYTHQSKIALSVPNRAVLYHFLNSTNESNIIEHSVESINKEIKVVEQRVKQINIDEKILPSEPIVDEEALKELEKTYIQESISLHYLDQFLSKDEESLKNTDSEKSENKDQPQTFSSWLAQLSEVAIEKNTQKADLVRSFVQSTKSKEKKSFYNASEMAQKSITEDDSLVTETLANIYVAQKNYSKARQAFEKLSLLFPEKKSYFADKIKEIKNLK